MTVTASMSSCTFERSSSYTRDFCLMKQVMSLLNKVLNYLIPDDSCFYAHRTEKLAATRKLAANETQ
jgi:hypothetical protein